MDLTLKLFRAALERVGVVALESLGRELLSHRYLTADRTVQESVFAGGDGAVVNLGDRPFTLILEVKGRPDSDEGIKAEAAQRWVDAVNAEGSFGRWGYAIVRDPKETFAVVDQWTGEAR